MNDKEKKRFSNLSFVIPAMICIILSIVLFLKPPISIRAYFPFAIAVYIALFWLLYLLSEDFIRQYRMRVFDRNIPTLVISITSVIIILLQQKLWFQLLFGGLVMTLLPGLEHYK